MIVRPAAPADAGRLLEIYAYYVENTAVTFEYDVPSAEEFRGRIENTLKKYPYLCAEKDGRVIGYAYAGPFQMRAAYQWSAETTVYVDRDAKRQGIGKRLYTELEAALRAMGILNMYACIASTRKEDEYLTCDSAVFHENMGFILCGTFRSCGCKFGRWYDMIWMEKMIGEHTERPEKPFGYPETACGTVRKI